MPPVGFEPTISAGERPQTYALDRAATGMGGEIMYSARYTESYSWNWSPLHDLWDKGNLNFSHELNAKAHELHRKCETNVCMLGVTSGAVTGYQSQVARM